jgi:DNA-directed RNA polymerase specialized sigma24 family protein
MTTPQQLTPDQFDALAELLGGSSAPLRQALRLVLVDGLSQVDAAALAGVARPNLTRRVQQARAVIDAARRLIGAA